MTTYYASLGRIVLAKGANDLEYRPAIIVRVWGDPYDEATPVNVRVFTDGANENMRSDWLTSLKHRDHAGEGNAHWIWPQELE